jgi:hypothetical protein
MHAPLRRIGLQVLRQQVFRVQVDCYTHRQ